VRDGGVALQGACATSAPPGCGACLTTALRAPPDRWPGAPPCLVRCTHHALHDIHHAPHTTSHQSDGHGAHADAACPAPLLCAWNTHMHSRAHTCSHARTRTPKHTCMMRAHTQSCSHTLQKEALAIMTIEKANTTINRLLALQRLSELVCVVVDEAHMVADPGRCGSWGKAKKASCQVCAAARNDTGSILPNVCCAVYKLSRACLVLLAQGGSRNCLR